MNEVKRCVLGIQVSAVDYTQAVQSVVEAAQQRRSFQLSALAVHGLMTGVLDSAQRYRLNRFDLLVPDGQPVRWALNALHRTSLRERVYGPELTLRVCRAAAAMGLPVYFYGSRPEVLEKLTRNLTSRFPGLCIAGAEPSLFRRCTPEEKTAIAQRIKDSGAQIVFVGLGCPRQEVWCYEFREQLDMPTLAVGAAFDFHAGMLPQAPRYFQDAGLEWLFRLVQEPTRLWRRYLGLNPLFILGFLIQRLMGPRVFDSVGRPPEQELRYA